MNTLDRTYSSARDEKGCDMAELHSVNSFSWNLARAQRWDDATTYIHEKRD